ncbi:hypothetical protein KAU08_01505, partial [bacterium]|nr:hypothetical protein [bacterium]
EINMRIPTIIGMASVEDYFEKSYDIWDVVKYINEETEEDARIVLIEPRNMYVQRDFTIWYPFPTELTDEWGRIDYRNLYSSWLGDEIDYIVLTFGPNFRALSMVHFKSNPEPLQYPENIPDYFTPWWLRKQAAYLEPNLQFPESNQSEYRDPPPESRINSYDILSMHNLTMLAGEGYIEPVFLDDYTGLIYRIVPHDELEVDTE